MGTSRPLEAKRGGYGLGFKAHALSANPNARDFPGFG
jgi:hypothetical protein